MSIFEAHAIIGQEAAGVALNGRPTGQEKRVVTSTNGNVVPATTLRLGAFSV